MYKQLFQHSETQIQTTARYYSSPTDLAKMERLIIAIFIKGLENRLSCVVGGMYRADSEGRLALDRKLSNGY